MKIWSIESKGSCMVHGKVIICLFVESQCKNTATSKRTRVKIMITPFFQTRLGSYFFDKHSSEFGTSSMVYTWMWYLIWQ